MSIGDGVAGAGTNAIAMRAALVVISVRVFMNVLLISPPFATPSAPEMIAEAPAVSVRHRRAIPRLGPNLSGPHPCAGPLPAHRTAAAHNPGIRRSHRVGRDVWSDGHGRH